MAFRNRTNPAQSKIIFANILVRTFLGISNKEWGLVMIKMIARMKKGTDLP